ncbi:MAG: hypothetical protein QME74_01990 [Candidatus Edwardsbacteria bacterium]|nr:hypothetical protein [Candidatus Edwardsbacteria bacterium]
MPNHQPVENFGFVFEDAYQKAYRLCFLPHLRVSASPRRCSLNEWDG